MKKVEDMNTYFEWRQTTA